MIDQGKVVPLDGFRAVQGDASETVKPEVLLFHMEAYGFVGCVRRLQLVISEELDIYSKPDQFSAMASMLEGIAAGLREVAAKVATSGK